MTQITTRRARMTDAAAMTDLAFRSKQSNGYSNAFMEACREELAVTPARLAAAEYWVAEADAVWGLAALKVEGDAGEVHAFFVEPARKGRGIGKALWREIRTRADALELLQLFLDADPAAVPFYESLGFMVVGSTPSGSIPGRVLPRMALKLREATPAGHL